MLFVKNYETKNYSRVKPTIGVSAYCLEKLFDYACSAW